MRTITKITKTVTTTTVKDGVTITTELVSVCHDGDPDFDKTASQIDQEIDRMRHIMYKSLSNMRDMFGNLFKKHGT